MLAVVAAVLVFGFVVEPLLVCCHELGHAVVPIARGHETVIFLGGEVGYRVELGKLSVVVAPRGLLAPVTYGATASDAAAGRRTILAGALGGPAVSLLLLIVLGRSAVAGPAAPLRWLLVLTVAYLWFQTVFTLLPLRYPGWAGQYGDYRSDGQIVLDLLRGREPASE